MRRAAGIAMQVFACVAFHAACADPGAIDALPPALEAARQGDLSTLDALRTRGDGVRARDGVERSALHWAAWSGQTEVLRWLLAQGLDVEARARLDQRPLHLAALAGQLEAARALLDAGAEVDARNLYQMTPLHLTASVEVARLLLDRGADLHALDQRRMTPLHYTVKKDLAKLLIDRGASVIAVDEADTTPEQMTGVASCQPGALRVFPRRDRVRLRGDQATLQIVVLSVVAGPLRALRLEARADGVDVDVRPAQIATFAPTQSTLFELRVQRRPELLVGEIPLHLRWLAEGREVASCLLEVDSRPGPTPEDQGLIRAGTLPIRQRPAWLAYAVLGLAPLLLLGLWWVFVRRRRHS
ncbi:MAG: ankyrin repeat domain-containing protein [Pseudomonadota bacterium]